jgi:hypothetical protein
VEVAVEVDIMLHSEIAKAQLADLALSSSKPFQYHQIQMLLHSLRQEHGPHQLALHK